MRRAIAAASLVLGGCGACEPKQELLIAEAGAAAIAFDAGTAAVAPVDASVAVLPPPPPKPRCEAIGVTGEVRSRPLFVPEGERGMPVVSSTLLPEESWLDLGVGAKLTAKDPRSGRETSFEGPGHARACVDHEQESWLVSGAFSAVPGAGEQPGSEEWVATPIAVVRYASSNVRIQLARKAIEITVKGGHGPQVWTPKGIAARPALTTDSEGWAEALPGTTKLEASAPPFEDASVESAIEACSAAATDAETVARQLAEKDAPIKDLAPKHVIARRIARAACALAEVRVAGAEAARQPDAGQRAGGWRDILRKAGARWRSLPTD